MTTISSLDLLATVVYLFPLAACAALSIRCVRAEQNWNAAWISGTFLFAFLAATRLFGLHEAWRKSLKGWGKASGLYASRRFLQVELLTVGVACAFFLIAGLIWRNWPLLRGKRGARVVAIGAVGMFGHIGLLILRIVSLHSIDVLLYGPFKAGWVLSVGCSILVVYAASISWFSLTSRARH